MSSNSGKALKLDVPNYTGGGTSSATAAPPCAHIRLGAAGDCPGDDLLEDIGLSESTTTFF